MLKQRFRDFAFLIGCLLGNSKIELGSLSDKFGEDMSVFRVFDFAGRHGAQTSYAGDGMFRLKELGKDFLLKMEDIDLVDLFFSVKNNGKIDFFVSNDEVFAKIGNLFFLIPFPHGVCELVEVFLNEDYGAFNVNNGVVVDIGAYIGDTAIYFALKGAKKVLAFEPSPTIFNVAKKNIRINNLQQTVDIRNLAVAEKEGWTEFAYATNWPGRSSMVLAHILKSFQHQQVKTTTLTEIMKEVDHVDLLKMDCEGAEYQILPMALKEGNLDNIYNIVLEVHGSPQVILKILKVAQFKIAKHLSYPSGAHLISASKKST
jgi:FkbM family methyltransferase